MNYKLLIAYDVKEHALEDYYRFVITEFLPSASRLGLTMIEGWQTIYGDYPSRLIVFVAKDDKILQKALESNRWISIETKLDRFVEHYEKRVIKFKAGFQFFKPKSKS
ncbi:MAG: hypothetical protein B6242_13695 [Anaerolineaceae bacterium 4572_78]|nr:MAG: hypothetical protein B6242_13695 [Anaerolineaceae bacterium 4572_78]